MPVVPVAGSISSSNNPAVPKELTAAKQEDEDNMMEELKEKRKDFGLATGADAMSKCCSQILDVLEFLVKSI